MVAEHRLHPQSCRERFLKAFLDVVIMVETAQRSVISATAAIAFLYKSYNVHVSAGTIYPIVYKLRKDGYLRQLPYGAKKLFVLTNSGEKAVETFLGEMDEVCSIITTLNNK